MDAIYVRQSVDKSEYSISIESQIKDCIALSKTGDYEVYADRGYSGKNTDRPEFKRLISDIQNGRIEKVIVWKLDRISRSVADFAQMMEMFQEYKVKFISKNEPVVSTDEVDKSLNNVIYGILMVFAQFERETTRLRITENYYARGQQGFCLIARAPYGYQKVDTELMGKKTKMLEPIPEQVEIVKTMYKMYADDGYSLGQIQKWMHDKKLKTNKENPFTKHAIVRILGNPVYVCADADVYTFLQSKGIIITNPVSDFGGENGISFYGHQKKAEKNKQKAVSKEEYATIGLHKGIIQSDIWLRVQHKLMNNRNFGSSGTGTKSWLSGLVKCGYCGKGVCFKDGGRKGSKIYAICLGRIEKYCYEKKKAVTTDFLEGIVEKELLSYLQKLRVKTSTQKKTVSPEINKIKIEIASKDKEIDDYAAKIPYASIATMNIINREIERISNEKQELQKEYNRLIVQDNTPEFGGYNIDSVIAEWPEMDLEKRKHVAKVFIKKITLTDDDIKVLFY